MPYAVVQDVAASWPEYQRACALIGDRPTPAGLIVYAAGPIDAGVRVIELWESEAARQRFRNHALARTLADLGAPPWPEPTSRDLHAAHIVFGAATRATADHASPADSSRRDSGAP